MNHQQRQILAALMDWWVGDTRIHYKELRPMRTKRIIGIGELVAALDAPGGVAMDCSESVTLLLKLAGCGDPSGFGFNGAGDTQTMLDNQRLSHYTIPARADIGALLVLGPSGDLSEQHVCMVRRPGPNPLLFSHGGPDFNDPPHYVRLSDEAAAHKPPATFLNVASL